MNINTRLVIWRMQITEKNRQNWHGDFYLEVHLVATKLLPVETSSKVAADPLASGDSQVTLSHVECSHRPDHLLLFTSRSTRVALYGSRRVSTIPLTNTSPEHRIIFLWASQRRHTTTKPSRRWQHPRVTSTTGLQLDHLVPISCNLSIQCTRIALSLSENDLP